MSTQKQRKAVENMVENGGNVSKAMRDANYSIETAKNPKKLTESKGYKEILNELGLTEGLIAKSLVDDIKAKEKNRVQELRLGAEILGMKGEKEVSNTYYTQINIEKVSKEEVDLIEQFEQQLKEKKL